MPATSSDSLRLWLELPESARVGEPLRITLRARNVTDGPLHLHLRGREIAFDIAVTDEGGAVVWRRLEGETIPAILRLETLAPGATLELAATWDQRSSAGEPVSPGIYTVRGEFLTDAEPLATPPVELRIGPN